MFTVRSEHPMGARRAIDWVWRVGARPVLAIEIEGRDVPDDSLNGDKAKFLHLDPLCAKVIALYTVRGDASLRLPQGRPTAAAWIAANWMPRSSQDTIAVKLDTELFAAGGIEQLQRLAIERMELMALHR